MTCTVIILRPDRPQSVTPNLQQRDALRMAKRHSLKHPDHLVSVIDDNLDLLWQRPINAPNGPLGVDPQRTPPSAAA
jgi:hypothetical protein